MRDLPFARFLNAQVWHPHYREVTALDTLDGKDDFPAEKEHDRIAAVLRAWSAGLLGSPGNTQAIAGVLAADFLGATWQPAVARVVRAGPALEVSEIRFAGEAPVGPEGFLRSLRAAIGSYSRILTAEFQVTRIVVAAGRGRDARAI